jgi:accessory gene regulator B
LHSGPILTILSATILLFTAPKGIKDVSRINAKYYPLLKLLSVLFVLTNLYFQSSILALAFFTQAFHTTKLGYTVIHLLEKAMNHTLRREDTTT